MFLVVSKLRCGSHAENTLDSKIGALLMLPDFPIPLSSILKIQSFPSFDPDIK